RPDRHHGQEAARLRLPDPRRPDEGTQEVRPQGRPQGVPVLQALSGPLPAPVEKLPWRARPPRAAPPATPRSNPTPTAVRPAASPWASSGSPKDPNAGARTSP